MKTDKIKVGYSTSIPIMSYGIKDVAWAEVEVSGDHSFKEVWDELKEKVDAAVREKYPHLYTASGKPITIDIIPDVQVQNTPEEVAVEEKIWEIRGSSTINNLNWRKTFVENNEKKYPILRTEFDKRLKELEG